ncbi:MAG: UvrD-helicase domain-containing protein [Candidatus Portiera sp.]|nr:UvrD-helicase domain-containing protein [Portiera sp.]
MSRKSSIDHQQSIIVKAPAGSGKTEMLVQRYLALLARDCNDPCQIVAITFTRKAAAEMLSRIRKELTFAKDPSYSPTQEYKQETYKLAQEVLSKAAKNKWHLASLVTEDNVTTIDAFCHTLVSLSPLKAGFLTMPEIFTNSDIGNLYTEASEMAMQTMKDGALDGLGNNLNKSSNKNSNKGLDKDREILKQLLYLHNNSPAKLKESIAQILSNRTAVLPLIQNPNYNPQEQLEQLCSLLSNRLSALAPDDWLPRITAALNANRHNFEEVYGKPFSLPPLDTDWQEASLTDWQALADILLTQTGGLRKQFNKSSGFIKDTQEKEDIVKLVDLARAIYPEEWLTLLAECRNWRAEYTPGELKTAKMAQRIIKIAAAHLVQIFKRENKCDHTEIMLAAIEVMGQEQAPTLLAERLGHNLKHLLVDEFQDTSVGQLKLLEAITSSWDESMSNSLFLVGDPMQSIYAFRQADVRIFNRLWDECSLGQIPLKQLTLKENYRSSKPIVEWLNTNFKDIFPKRANNLINSVAYTPAEAMNDPDNSLQPAHLAVMHHEDITPTNEQVFSPVLAKIKHIIENEPTATIGILARKRSDATGVLPLLHKEKIEFDAGKFSSMAENPLIIDLMSLTRAIYNSEDEIAWYACLRAPWCGLKLQDILTVSRLNRDVANKNLSLWDLLQKIAKQPSDQTDVISVNGLQRIMHLVSRLSLPMSIRRRTNWHSVINQAWTALRGNEFAATPKDLGDIELFMDNLQEVSSVATASRVSTGGEINLPEMESRLKLQGATFVSNSRVKIMTIHHSKGLEFDYVFIVNMNKRSGGNIGTSGLLDVADFLMDDMNQTGAVISVNAPGYLPGDKPVHEMLKDIKKTQQDQELRRLFYVASSRARLGLFLHYLVKYKEGKEYELKAAANSFLKLLEPEMLSEGLDDIKDIYRKQQDEKSKEVAVMRRISTTELIEFVEQPKSDTKTQPFPEWHSPYDRTRGTAIHLVMELLAATSNEQLQQLISADSTSNRKSNNSSHNKSRQEFLDNISIEVKQLMRRQGLDQQESQQILASIKDTVDFCLEDKRAIWILRHDGMNECGFMFKNAPSIRIDRTFVEGEGDKATRWIVDYKTSEKGHFTDADLEKFHKQLSTYGKAMDIFQKSNQDAKQLPIKLGIYCPQNGFWQEWDYLG